MKQNFNKLIAIMVACSSMIAVAETSMYFVNQTPYMLTVNYSTVHAPAAMTEGSWKTGPRIIYPAQRVSLMTVPRGGLALDPSASYKFYATISGLPDGKQFGMALDVKTSSIHGAGKTSSIKATTYPVGQNPTWYDANNARSFNIKEQIGSKTFTSAFKWIGLHPGSVYEDIEYTLAETGTVTDQKKLTLLQSNIQQRPFKEASHYEAGLGHNERTQLSTITLPAVLKQFNADVVTVNEAFSAPLRPALTNEMRKAGFMYATDAVGMKTSKAWSGGVMVFSKYPFKKTAELVYQNSANADANAAKGAWYVQIDKGGMLYNIFATHTNASYTFDGKTRLPMDDVGRTARKGQFAELAAFIKAQNIPSNQPVIIVGDMNVDMLSEKGKSGDEFAYMLQTLNATLPQITGPMYTFNVNANEWVAPTDGPVQYLDFALYGNAYLRPKSSFNKPICLKSDGSNDCTKGRPGGKRDLSDHFPLLAEFNF